MARAPSLLLLSSPLLYLHTTGPGRANVQRDLAAPASAAEWSAAGRKRVTNANRSNCHEAVEIWARSAELFVVSFVHYRRL